MALRATPKLPHGGQWATFLRNHDEIDLSRLTADQREQVFAEFGPDPAMRLYDRGIRRRLAPMLGNDQRRIRLALALTMALPGTRVRRRDGELRGAQLAAEQAFEGDARHRFATSRRASSTSVALERPSSRTTRPSARNRMRSAIAAALASWVTMIVVWP